MRGFILFLTFFMLAFSPAMAQTSWEKLIKDIEKPDMSANQPADKASGPLLSMPDMNAQSSTKAEAKDDVRMKMVTSYKCENPDIPDCLFDLRYKPRVVDVENCRDMTALYLQAVASYNRCVDRRSRKHARHIVNFFNCAAAKREDCTTLYGDD
ncbi:MAG: hypothetical protein ACNI26_14915 [Terasakiella sp.]|uniref:hypothetical protein n=1 Tax=unclassified Terasakiella TaxID=2614952 RepID=UPI003AFFE7AF